MKRLLILLVPVFFAGCAMDEEGLNVDNQVLAVIDSFERNMPEGKSYVYGYEDDILDFQYFVNEEYGYWGGFAQCNGYNMEDGTYANQYSVYNTSAATGNSYLLYYYDSYNEPCDILCRYFGNYQFTTVRLNLTTYTYKSITEEDVNTFARAFTEGDYLKVTFTALMENKTEGVSTECYVVDYREGRRFVATNWDTFDISALSGELWGIRVRIETSDVGEYGANTPLYICMDDLTFTVDFL
ncbi:MAG: DUF4465 domain-containing protein [Alistipes sp.]|nr:DUF4465 domain-containing protein [Alistipes sp.]